ncbi:hypothetical protein GPJ56_002264 [Histomonas meleagridis]|uniref:uncharacterized protein n=1 Tax=Histomonas meleagridis TaxID=135588 RepID=UPI003559AE22|nr:hypothetical protein GPJ56_002264 [Histomonas meleagridis]KAH0802956.1 hypothetical protein GO595_004463 [Histomonas meleagridis]
MPSLLPVISKAVPLIYENASTNEFHEFFTHFLETWSRESTTAVASYSFSVEISQILPFLGLCASRYIKIFLGIMTKRLMFSKSISHTAKFLIALRTLCEQTYPVIRANSKEINTLIEKAKEIAKENDSGDKKRIYDECDRIEDILRNSPELPEF